MDDVDAFLASLEQFAAPSIDGGIQRANAASSSQATAQSTTQASGVAPPVNRRQATARVKREREEDATSLGTSNTEPGMLVVGDAQPSSAQPAPPLAPFSSSRARANAQDDQRRRRTGSPPPPLSSASPQRWNCARCTFLNDATCTRCGMCEAERPLHQHTSAPADTSRLVAERACPRCTLLNPAHRSTCSVCEARLPPMANVEVVPHKDGSATAPNRSHLSPLAPHGQPVPDSTAPPTAEPHKADGENVVSDDEDEEDDSDEESALADSDSDGPGDGRHTTEDMNRSRELVSFLQSLEAVPFEKLPYADVPTTMQEKAHLHPFQRQALHWMLSREGQAPRLATSLTTQKSTVNVDGEADMTEDDPTLFASLDPHQVRGGVLADYMGMGKTRTLIALCEATRGPHYDRVTGSQIASPATLIVCPTALMAQWASEIRECVSVPSSPPQTTGWSRTAGPAPAAATTSAPKVLLYYGSRKRRVSLFDLAQKYDYVITTYQTLCHEPPVDTFNGPPGKVYMIRWKRIILDEAHGIRNMRTRQSRTCLQLTGVYRWAVTATPIHNSINDLYPLLRFLQVPYFSDLNWWNREIVNYFNQDPQHPRSTTALKMLFAALLLRRTPDSVVNGEPILKMPPKLIVTREIALSKAEREFYQAVKENAMSKLDEAQSRSGRFSNTSLTTFSTAFTMLMRCRQACLHPYIVVAALRRIKLQLSATEEADEVRGVAVGGVAGAPPSITSAAGAAQAQLEEAERARRAEAEAAAAASAFQNAVNRYVDAVLMKKMRSSVTRGDSAFLRDLVSELSQHKLTERECIICLDTLCRPAILPCAHTFCYECIHQALHVTRKCPLCKQATRPGDVLEVPEELIRRPGSSNSNNSSGGDGDTGTAPTGTSAKDTQVNLAAAMRAMNASEHVLRDPAQWPLLLSAKTAFLLDAITRKIPSTEKVVVFSHFVTYLLYAQQILEQHGVACALYTGALSMRQREKLLTCFRDDSGQPSTPRVLLATITTCGVGLNLTCANHCFLMEPTWNPGVEEQALNRVHRIGQTRAVEVTKLIARDTVEERVEALCQFKKGLSAVCFGGGSGNARVSTRDLLNLFKDPTPATTSTDEDEKSSSSSSDDDSSDSADTLSSSSDTDGPAEGRRHARRPPPRAPRRRQSRHHPTQAGEGSRTAPQTAASRGPADGASTPTRGDASSQGRPSSTLSPQQRVLEACQRGLSILHRSMRGN